MIVEIDDVQRTHVPHLEPYAYNQKPKTSDHRDLKLYRYGETSIYQWWSKRERSVFEDPCDHPFIIINPPPVQGG